MWEQQHGGGRCASTTGNSTFVGAVLQVGGRMAYAAQQAWIVNATVKGNVTFGRPFDEDRWRMCVEVSAAGCLGC